jgi:hypothetical protein
LDFIVEVSELQQELQASNSETKQVVEKANVIVKTYVGADAQRPVNISASVSGKLIQDITDANQVQDQTFDKAKVSEMFGPPKQQIKSVIIQNGFLDDFLESVSGNITEDEVKNRRIISVISMLLSLGLVALLMAIDASRWWRLFTIITTGLSASYFWSAFYTT